jgi:hypothetical protein
MVAVNASTRSLPGRTSAAQVSPSLTPPADVDRSRAAPAVHGARDWRLSLDAKLDKGRALLIEHRLVAGCMRRGGDPNWVGIEEDFAVIHVQLNVNRSYAHLASRCIATISLPRTAWPPRNRRSGRCA